MSTQVQKAVTVVVEAYSCDDNFDGLAYASFVLNEHLLAKLECLIAVAKQHSLSEVRQTSHPECWGPGDIETDMRLQDGELVLVPDGSFWFVDSPKNCAGIECRAMTVSGMREQFELAEPGSTIYITEQDEDDLQEVYEEDHPPVIDASNVCTDCREPFAELIGCPDGAEVCKECFDNGKH